MKYCPVLMMPKSSHGINRTTSTHFNIFVYYNDPRMDDGNQRTEKKSLLLLLSTTESELWDSIE